MEKVLFIPDLHIPYHNPKLVNLVLRFVAYFKPHYIFLMGDVIDCYQLSRFDTNPRRLLGLQDDIDEAKDFLKELKQKSKNAKRFFIEGNHEDRLKKYLWKHPEISQLSVLTMDSLLELKDKAIDCKLVDYDSDLIMWNWYITHGSKVRVHSAYSARGELEKNGIKGISGHTHRIGFHTKTDLSGTKGWWEIGCLCLTQEYIKGRPNWQEAFMVGYVDGGEMYPQLIPIENDRFVFNKKLWVA